MAQFQKLTATQATTTGHRRLPYLTRQGNATQLIVDGKPFLIRGGELGNSTASSLDYLKPLWPQFVELHLNTILAPVYWDLIEPQEGAFDFSLVDGLIEQARSHGIRLILLWFGTWKNCMSCYVPSWVKQDHQRFPRAKRSNGLGMEMLSAFHEENRNADVRAFTALMQRIREIDRDHQTVFMVQVQNEIGMIPEARDFSDVANQHFADQVPDQLMRYLSAHRDALAPEIQTAWKNSGYPEQGTWSEVFGHGMHTDEIFQAWHYAHYVEFVTAAGKAEYPLPMFVNAALIRPGYHPGRYASAGPLPHLIDIWRAGAPSIDFLAPDIYFQNFVEWCRRYDVSGNPLFIPEAQRSVQNVANAFYAVGAHGALGISPFAIEATQNPLASQLARVYHILDQLSPILGQHQGHDTLKGAAPDIAFDGSIRSTSQRLSLGDYTFIVTFEPYLPTWTPPAPTVEDDRTEVGSGGLFIEIGQDEFLIAGTGITVTFETNDPSQLVGILDIQEGKFVDGRWVPERWLNGDQSHQGRHLRIPPGHYEIQRLRLYRYR